MTLTADARALVASDAPRRALGYLPATAFVIDLLVITVICAAAIVGRDTVLPLSSGERVAGMLDLAGPLLIAGWMIGIALVGGYQRDVFGAGTDEYKRILNASLLTAAATGITCYLTQFQLSRGFFLLTFVLGVPLLVVGRYTLRRALHRAHRAGHLLSRVVISGSPEHVDEIAKVLARETWLGFQVIGALTPTYSRADLTPGGIPVVGHSAHVSSAVREHSPDIVFFADNSLGSGESMRQVVWDLEENDVQVVVAPSVADVSRERVKVRPVAGLPLIHIEKPRWLQATSRAKRTFDVFGSLALLVAFAPLMLFAAVRIFAHDNGPVLFRQTRVGRDGALFNCLKFRTMVTNAETLLAELKAQNEAQALFKMKDDPRVTLPGRWLRRYSLDELPQLINVLRGDMSLIGPRPGLPQEAALYSNDVERRLRVRPGMTGLWQVSGRSDLSYEEAVRLDLYYVDNWSMVTDLQILARTLGAVTSSRGAY